MIGSLQGKVLRIDGVEKLYGADMVATDLRAGAALVLAALSANGTSTVDNIEFVERGYEDLVNKLKNLGADIIKIGG